jgi:hypothetical protein
MIILEKQLSLILHLLLDFDFFIFILHTRINHLGYIEVHMEYNDKRKNVFITIELVVHF